VCKPSCADLPTAPTKSNKQIKSKEHSEIELVKKEISRGKFETAEAITKTVEESSARNSKKIAKIPNANPKSPTRLTIIALIAALFACNRANQKLISK
jgi:hypothetical protein